MQGTEIFHHSPPASIHGLLLAKDNCNCGDLELAKQIIHSSRASAQLSKKEKKERKKERKREMEQMSQKMDNPSTINYHYETVIM